MAQAHGEFGVGREFETVLVDCLTRTQIVQYAGAAGDFNPLHTDEVFAITVAGYGSTIAHGMLTMGMTGRFLTDLLGDDRLVRFGGRFVAIVWPGDTLRVRATIDAVDSDARKLVELSLITRNQHGDAVFVGYASARHAN